MGLRVVALVSSVIGGGSLALLAVFLLVGSFELVPMGLSPRSTMFWNATLCLVFFVQHSGMIRQTFARTTARVIPRHLYGAVFSIASGGALLLLLFLWQRSPVEVWSVDEPWRWLLVVGIGLAITGFAAGVRALGGFDGFGLRPIRDRLRGRDRPPTPLTVRGPYRWVRHPLYSCVLLMLWSCPDVTADRLLLNILWTAWVIVGTILEERDLNRDFGGEYADYQAAVPMLIPWTLRPRWPRS